MSKNTIGADVFHQELQINSRKYVALWIFVLYQDYQSSGVCSVKDDDDAVPAEVDEQQSYMQAGDVLETLFMNG